MAKNVIMACGCTSHARLKTEAGDVPACVVHDCIEVAAEQPNLNGRTAVCCYGKHAEKPSSPNLPFFEYLGPGSREAKQRCECGFWIDAHWPTWTCHIKSARRWFKHDRVEETKTFTQGLPNEKTAQAWANKQVKTWLNWSNNEETRIYEAELIKLVKSAPRQAHSFKARGPAQHDKYYCGCHGWD